jgi:hypothetical protein
MQQLILWERSDRQALPAAVLGLGQSLRAGLHLKAELTGDVLWGFYVL